MATRATAHHVLIPMSRVIADHRGHWFDPDTMRFFGTRLTQHAYELTDGRRLFVSSEQPPHGPRRWSLRAQDPNTGKIDTVGEFCGYASRGAALYALSLALRESNES